MPTLQILPTSDCLIALGIFPKYTSYPFVGKSSSMGIVLGRNDGVGCMREAAVAIYWGVAMHQKIKTRDSRTM